MRVSEKVIKEFTSITGADHETGKHFLEACSGNLETAVTMFLDGKMDNQESGATADANPDNVRSPIPQTSGVLVGTPYASTSHSRWRPRRKARSVFDGIRDYKEEPKPQENLSSNPAKRRRMKRLEDLFRPPIELTHKGNFESAREEGQKTQKWLMVNVQNVQEFSCQVLNRDVWSNTQVQRRIKEDFVFLQVYTDSPEGGRFMQFYAVASWPHVSLIDPRTGERLAVWTNITADSISSQIEVFLADNGTIGEESEPPNKKSKADLCFSDEDSQLAAAIAASLKENEAEPKGDDSFLVNDSSDLSELDVTDEEQNVSDQEHKQKGSKMATATSHGTQMAAASLGRKTAAATSNGAKMESIENSATQNGGHMLSACVDIEGTKVEGDYFCGKSEFADSNLPKTNGTCTKRVSSPKKGCEKGEKRPKKFTKVKPKMLKLGSIKNGKDFSNLTTDKYGDETETNCMRGQNHQQEVCQIMLRLPDGSREQISLSSELTFEHLEMEVEEKGYPPASHEIITNFPRKNLSACGRGKTLKDLNLCPRAAVFIQEKD